LLSALRVTLIKIDVDSLHDFALLAFVHDVIAETGSVLAINRPNGGGFEVASRKIAGSLLVALAVLPLAESADVFLFDGIVHFLLLRKAS
jgi:hypothetical protein